jgi:hypothetical protein
MNSPFPVEKVVPNQDKPVTRRTIPPFLTAGKRRIADFRGFSAVMLIRNVKRAPKRAFLRFP